MGPARAHLGLAVLAALLLAACQRTLVELPTAVGGVLSVTPTPWPTVTAERSAAIEQAEGTVQVQAQGSHTWAPAIEGQTLSEGDQVRTLGNSRVLIRLTEGSKIRLGPDTAFTVQILNPYLDSLLTSLKLDRGEVWVLLRDGALDVETQRGIAAARAAYMSVKIDKQTQSISVTCLQGTCSFGNLFVPAGAKLLRSGQTGAAPEPMTLADYGAWGLNVPEATQLAYLATEAVVQGSATLPVVATPTPAATFTPLPTATPSPEPTRPPDQPTPEATPTAPPATPTPRPLTATPVPFTPIPPAPALGRHVVAGGETLFCIARGYGVLPAAIAQANGLPSPFTVFPGQVLRIPAVRWDDILSGPVCRPQFASPYPALPFETATPTATATLAGPPLKVSVFILCVHNCGSQEGDYILQIDVKAEGGRSPYTYTPGQSFRATIRHCVTGTGLVTVTSADGQSASTTWTFVDVNCPPTTGP